MPPLRRPALRVARLLVASTAVFLLSAHADSYDDIAALLQSGRAAQALTLAEQQLAAHPRDPQLQFLRAVALSDAGRQDEAMASLTRLTQDYPELPEPYNNLAVLYAQRNQLEPARAALVMAIRTNPNYAAAYENLGDVYARLAGEAYSKALELDPGRADSLEPKLTRIGRLESAAAPGAQAGSR